MTTGAAKPVQSTPCTAASTCDCMTDSDCPSTHWTCNTTNHRCGCSARWGGDVCDIPLLLPPSSAAPCMDGVVDMNGTCSAGFIDSTTGISCPVGSNVDWAGRCCSAGAVDSCGVCGGKGIAVDVLGTCCFSALLPSGLCCEEGEPDSCGVCGGLNNCTYVWRGSSSEQAGRVCGWVCGCGCQGWGGGGE